MTSSESEKSKTGKEWLSCRDVLWYLVFCGFAVNYMLRINLSLTIVAMVIPKPESVSNAQCAVQGMKLNLDQSSPRTSASLVKNITEHNVNDNFVASLDPKNYSDRFSWDEYEQGLALGGYYWVHWMMQIPGGFLARSYGTKCVFGWSNLGTALLGFLLPWAANLNLYAFVFLRGLQGFVEGFAWPAMHHMTAKWIPPTERSKFISAYLGSSVGAALTYPLCVVIINWFGWEAVFHVTSALGVLWYVAWYNLAFDTPQEHPRISETERNYILENLGDDVSHGSAKRVPWKAILTSSPLWLTALAQTGGSWGLLTLMSESPSYFNYIHGWNINAAGVLSAAPQAMRMVFSYTFSSFVDWLRRTNRMSVTHVRKLAMFVCNGIQGVLLLGLAYSGCHPILAIVFMVSGIATSGALSAGTLASCVDLSPNYASILLGFCNTFSLTPGLIAPMMIGFLTNNNQSIEQWRLVFLITTAITVFTGALYVFFGTSDLQRWNDVEDNEGKFEEVQELRSNGDSVEYM